MDFGYYNMDCMDGMKEFPDGYFDLAIVDPPYGLHEHGGKNRNTYVKQKNGTKTYVKDGQYENRASARAAAQHLAQRRHEGHQIPRLGRL